MGKLVIYGAGTFGKGVGGFINSLGKGDDIAAYCDKRAKEIGMLHDKAVLSYEEASRLGLPFIIAVSRRYKRFNEIKEVLENDQQVVIDLNDWARENGMDMVEFNRQYCAYFHVTEMDDYFQEAESVDSVQKFWGGGTLFYQRFHQLDLTNVVELACGRGRHVPMYVDKAGEITLVDILQKNIDICQERFKEYSQIKYYCNNGQDMKDLADNAYTALFTYDAMVHFELLDIFNYLKETHRILKKGGRALFHHSNTHDDYRRSFHNSPGGRSFMSSELFAYMAYRAGFKILSQDLIDWAMPEGDCLTLVEKL